MLGRTVAVTVATGAMPTTSPTSAKKGKRTADMRGAEIIFDDECSPL
jgi:hypothetical protein